MHGGVSLRSGQPKPYCGGNFILGSSDLSLAQRRRRPDFFGLFLPLWAPNVMHTVARARGGEGPPWGCTVIPLLGDTTLVMQPQVPPTSGRAHSRAAPGQAPGQVMYFKAKPDGNPRGKPCETVAKSAAKSRAETPPKGVH